MTRPRRFLASTVLLITCLSSSSCWIWKSTEKPAPLVQHPGGVIRQVHFPEKYIIFEASHPFNPGDELRVFRPDGSRAGRVRVTSISEKSFQAADILEGLPHRGDVVEKALRTPQAETGD